MTAEQLIDALQGQGLLPDATIAKLRKKIGASEKALSAKSLARYLIDKELVTKQQALGLLVEGGEVSKPAGRQEGPSVATKLAGMPDPGGSPLDELQDLSSSAEWAMEEESKFSSAASEAIGSEAKSSSKSKKKGKKKASDWDSPVILIGGGLVVACLLVGATIIYILSSEDTDKILAEARGAMESNNHATAIENFEKFLGKASGHPERSKARMELAMTRIRQNLALSPQKAFEVAKTELGATANEGDFRQAEEHLSDLLPRIADELAKKAASSEKPEESQEFLVLAQEALGMAHNTKYIPKARRDVTQLEGIRETIEVVERKQQALIDQEATLAKIEAANSSGDAGTAFNEYEQLIEKHPGLLGNQRLAEALEKTAQTELVGIKFQAETVEATPSDRESPVKAALGMVSVRQAGQAPVSGMYYVPVAGVLYGVNASDGEVVWRRYVGVKTEPSYPRVIGEDIVLLETTGAEENSQQELVRMEGASGKVLWRLPLDDKCAEPVVHGERIYLSGSSGKLHVVNAETGRQEGYVKFSQPLASPPAVNADKGVLYVAGEHSSLYSINLADNSCIGVHYTRHGRGAVKAAPAVVLDKLVVVENDGAQTCKLRAFSLNAQGAIEQGIQERRLDGRVVRSPLVSGRRVVVLTDRGQISVYEVSAGSEGEALSNLANRPAMGGSPFLRFAAVADRDIWFGENSLSKFVVAPAGNRLTIQELTEDYNRSQFVAPLEVRDGVVLHVRSRRGHAGFTVTASSVENGKPYWEVDVAAPPAGDPVSSADGKGVLRADANGQTHLFQPTGGGSQFVRLELQGSSPQRELATYEYSTPLQSGGAVYTRRGDSTAVWQQSSGESRVLELPGQLACEPVAFGEGWLAPLALGQVFYIGGANGAPVAAPFQPPLSAGEGVAWLTPASLGDDQFVITDGVKKLYLVEFDDSNVPQLRATMEGEVGESPVVTPLAAAGEYVYGATRVGHCIAYRTGTLERQAPVDLGAPVLWGPYAAGSLVLFHTAAGQLVAFDGSGQKVWEHSFPHGQITGAPMTRQDHCLLATDTGSIVTVALADGTLAAATQVDEPLMGGPAQVMGSLVVAATDGTLLVVDSPTESGGRN